MPRPLRSVGSAPPGNPGPPGVEQQQDAAVVEPEGGHQLVRPLDEPQPEQLRVEGGRGGEVVSVENRLVDPRRPHGREP